MNKFERYQTRNFACLKPSWALSSQILQPKGKKSVQMSCVEISIDSIKLANFSCDMATYKVEWYILPVVWFTLLQCMNFASNKTLAF